ncbi:RNA-binding transcriptional accessory protein [Carboxylicivirga mesophila]|uniref:RNA-binding transcriptional accessory protein n=1 Tax=Carboxylicivirga mesophila TaxID=1166478 RepID=A0ABS5K805_9BACT|nr:Tex family protein [Carboxylicivirga mesophila]MBS2211134.1 RNA-binding transcriptional accessory protein [Carboxylicivirga mesophila]
MQLTQLIAKELSLPLKGVENTVTLLDEGATIPFISRYRKEMTGSLDELQVGAIKERYEKLQELEKRKETILKSMDEQDVLTPELEAKIKSCYNATELEDIYLPYKPKRKTRAVKAKEKGLEPLAKIVMKQYERDIEGRAASFVNDEVADVDEALQGARDIIAEWVNEHQVAREIVRSVFDKEATICSKVVKGKEEEGVKYKDYFDWNEPLKRCPSHRFMAMRRGEKEGFLKLTIAPDAENSIQRLDRFFVKGNTSASEQVADAVADAYKRLLAPSIETEFTRLSAEKSDTEAIRVFSENLRQLLLASPLGQKRVLALDPGYRTGCKVVCLDAQGNLLDNATIYPHPPQNDYPKSAQTITALIDKHQIEAIAIGNGTASRETEAFAKGLRLKQSVQIFVVSEDGASVYSAGKVAREEFPDYDVTVRGAVSIGRRLMDPLAELVKIDPKSIGVGQYQHDVDQTQLKKSLDTVVESCVNSVGVNLNTASKHLLTYVSGLGPQLAQNIVDFRAENGAFDSRDKLKKVPRLGAKAFEQAAGFLRIQNAKNPLDNTAVHPEAYKVVKQMAADLGCKVDDLVKDKALRDKIKLQNYVSDTIGLPTLTDIMKELDKPGRDPRSEIKAFEFAEGIYSIDDLYEGMVLPGLVTNITNFGAFVDIGVKQDGLVHISQMADRYISDPNEVVKLQQQVKVKVMEVDRVRKRIQLSMKNA